MKKVSKGIEPPLLANYRDINPDNEWEQFTSKKYRRNQTQVQIKADQGGLCAYCEIDLVEKIEDELDDFRVEHFHPKSDGTVPHNWHLDWQNLLGCCHGGSQRNVVDASYRFTSPDVSCDVPKGSQNLDNVILNPLHIPAFPKLFSCERTTGEFSVDSENCEQANISVEKAQNTIVELNLDTERLRRFRREILNKLNDDVRRLVSQGFSIGEAQKRLAEVNLKKNTNGHWPKFFTSIRSYLGSTAERQLLSIHYDG